MMGFENMKMFLSLGILCFLLDNGLGAPSRGRYMWLKCHPNGLDPNCVKQKGPVMASLHGLPDKLPAAALHGLINENSALDLEALMEVAKEQRMEKQEVEVYKADPEEQEQEEEVYEADPEEQEVYEADPEEQEEEEVYEADPEEQEQEEEVYEADPEEQEQEQEVYEADPEEQEEVQKQPESVPEVMEPGERPAEEGSAAGPFLNEEGSGEQWADYSSVALHGLTGPARPHVQEMREEHLIL